jgi:hypothetical protein
LQEYPLVDSLTFWSEHPPEEAMTIAYRLLGVNLRHNQYDLFTGHHILGVGYPRDFDLSAIEPQLRSDLDAINWLFISTGLVIEF